MSGLTTCLTTYEKKPNRGVAQLVARCVRDAKVVGSNPVASTNMELGFNFRTVYLDFSRVNPYFLYENKGVLRFSTFGHLKLKKLNFNKKVELG